MNKIVRTPHREGRCATHLCLVQISGCYPSWWWIISTKNQTVRYLSDNTSWLQHGCSKVASQLQRRLGSVWMSKYGFHLASSQFNRIIPMLPITGNSLMIRCSARQPRPATSTVCTYFTLLHVLLNRFVPLLGIYVL